MHLIWVSVWIEINKAINQTAKEAMPCDYEILTNIQRITVQKEFKN